jgi:hypothetical protein
VRRVPDVSTCGTPLDVARNVTARPVHVRARAPRRAGRRAGGRSVAVMGLVGSGRVTSKRLDGQGRKREIAPPTCSPSRHDSPRRRAHCAATTTHIGTRLPTRQSSQGVCAVKPGRRVITLGTTAATAPIGAPAATRDQPTRGPSRTVRATLGALILRAFSRVAGPLRDGVRLLGRGLAYRQAARGRVASRAVRATCRLPRSWGRPVRHRHSSGLSRVAAPLRALLSAPGTLGGREPIACLSWSHRRDPRRPRLAAIEHPQVRPAASAATASNRVGRSCRARSRAAW